MTIRPRRVEILAGQLMEASRNDRFPTLLQRQAIGVKTSPSACYLPCEHPPRLEWDIQCSSAALYAISVDCALQARRRRWVIVGGLSLLMLGWFSGRVPVSGSWASAAAAHRGANGSAELLGAG